MNTFLKLLIRETKKGNQSLFFLQTVIFGAYVKQIDDCWTYVILFQRTEIKKNISENFGDHALYY